MNQKENDLKSSDKISRFFCKYIVLMGGGKTLPAIMLLMLCAFFNHIAAQSSAFCGTYSTTPASSSNPDSVLIDRFGNTYDLEQLLLPANRTGSATCSDAGYFDPFFLGDPPAEVLDVFCQVLSDLSALIPQRTSSNACGNLTPQKVNLQIAWINFTNPDPVVLSDLRITATSIDPAMKGMGTSFMLSPSDNSCEEVGISRAFAKINGANPPSGVTAPDGRLLLNAAVNWNTNTSAQTGIFRASSIYIPLFNTK